VSARPLALALLLTALTGCAGAYRLDEASAALRRAPRDVLRLIWERPMTTPEFLEYKPQEWASAAIDPAGGVLYIGSSAGRFLALRLRDGQELWSLKTEGPVASRPLLVPSTSTIYFGCDDGHLYAVDTRDGTLKWRYTTEGTINGQPAYADGILLFTSSEGRIYAVDASNGTWRWQYDRESPEGFTIQGYAGVTVSGSTVYTGFADGVLVAMKIYSGDVIWTRSLASGKAQFTDVDSTPVLSHGVLLATSYATGLYALAPDTGSIRWQFPVEGASTPAVQGDTIYLSAPKAGLIALDFDGRTRWRQGITKGVPSRPLVVGSYVFLTGTESGLHAASAVNGELLQYFDPGGISAPPSAAGGILATLTNAGRLYAFQIVRRQAPAASATRRQ